MKPWKFIATGAALSVFAQSVGAADIAQAESKYPHTISANVSLATNYMFRGISQTDDGLAIQGEFNYENDPYNVYAGVWAANVDSTSGGYDGASMELDLYAGWTPSWQNIDFDLGYIRYQYPGTDTSENNTDEFHLGLFYDVQDQFTPGYTAHYSDDFFGSGPAWYHDLSLEIPLPYDFTLAGHYGWNRFDDSTDNYRDYSIGIATEYSGFEFDLSWIDRSDKEACSAPFQCGSTAVFKLSKSF